MAGVIVGHPLDTVKVVQQTKTTGIIDTIRLISKHGGILVFFRGMGAPLLTTGALNAIFFGAYGNSLETIFGCVETSEKSSRSRINEPFPYWTHFVAGCIGGLAQLGLGCPIDVVKVQLQARPSSIVKNPVHCVQQILKSNGIPGLYKGFVCHAWRDVPSSGLYFIVYKFSKRQLEGKQEFGGQHRVHFVSGGVAGVLSWWSTLPLDVIKSRLQGDCPKNPSYNGMVHCASVIFKTKGVQGLFQGFWMLSLRAFIVNGVIFQTYEYLWGHSHVIRGKFNSL